MYCADFWYKHCFVCLNCDWLKWLLWFWFYDTQLKTAHSLEVDNTKTFCILQNETVCFVVFTWRHMSFCLVSEPSSYTVSVKSSCSSTPEGISLSQDTRSLQTSSISWPILQCHDPGYGILPCYSVPIEQTYPKNQKRHTEVLNSNRATLLYTVYTILNLECEQ